MSRLINNKYGITILVMIAIAYCTSQIAFSSSTDIDMYADTPGMFDMEVSEADLTQGRSLKSVNIDKLFWQDANNKDPFILRTISSLQSKRIQKQSVTNKVTKKRLPNLSGFIVGKESKLAVLNGKVVKEGQNIKGFQILQINEDGVQLSSHASHEYFILSVD